MSNHCPHPVLAVLCIAAVAAGVSADAWGEDESASAQTSAEQVAPLPPAQPSPQSSPTPSSQPPAPPQDAIDPVDEWLDEVKTQRRAWEERRRSAKEAVNARRRRADPWGAAHQEAHEKETQRRHDALMEQVERDRETFRNQGPWQGQGPWEQGPPPPSVRQPMVPADQPQVGGTQEPLAPNSAAPPPAYPPSGWDNRWYFRGY
jgi:hypothetical protein